MEIRAFAERVLLGTTLAEKCAAPGMLTDEAPGRPIALPERPGRPDVLALHAPRERVPFPGVHTLAEPGQRGRVLHFFANHELLAAELMALALLRFPDAPAGFRRGLVATIEDEQRHLALYLERMAADGIALGDVPVSAFFWDTLRDVASPEAFVAGMSLTLEQANLDFAGFYAEAFRTIGDDATASALDQVFEDEIRHVSHGVRYFAQSRTPDDRRSLFARWQEALVWPLTPARARGVRFDADARRRAGLDTDYIEEVRIWGASRGRPPVVHRFNPSCEHEWLHGVGAPLGAAAAAVERDLTALPIVLAAQDDVVLVDRRPGRDHLRRLQAAGFAIPEFVEVPSPRSAVDLPHPHIGGLAPWGWTEGVAREMASIAPREIGAPRTLGERVAAARATHGKAFGVRCLSSYVPAVEEIALDLVCGAVVEDERDAWTAIVEWTKRGVDVRIKGESGAAGRHQLRVMAADMDETKVRRWVASNLRAHGGLVVEPERARLVDLSFVGRVERDGRVHVEGVTRGLVDAGGAWHGAVVGRPALGLTPELSRALHGEGRRPRYLAEVADDVLGHVGGQLRAAGVEGPFGVDAFVWRDERDGLRLRPIVEVNPRRTMGHVAAALRGRLAGGVSALLAVTRVRGLGAAGEDASGEGRGCTVGFRATPSRSGWVEGLLPLTECGAAGSVVAVAVVGSSLDGMVERMDTAGFGTRGVRAAMALAAG